MPLRPTDRNEAKLHTWSVKHNVSQTEILNTILDAVSDVVIDELMVESKRRGGVESRPLRIKRIATWG